MKLENKSAIVTGAAGGIGSAIVKQFAGEGAKIIATDVNAQALEGVVSEINRAGGQATAVPGDVTSEEDIRAMVKAATSTYGRLDIRVNNAGIMDKLTPLHDVDSDLWERVMSINLKGPAMLCREALKVMITQEAGVIVNVASVAGLRGGRAGPVYTTSKHGIVGLTKSIAWFYEPQGIRANVVCPGNIETELGTGGDPHKVGMRRYIPYFDTMPRFAKPEEIASAVVFLASDEASFVSGAVMAVDKSWSSY